MTVAVRVPRATSPADSAVALRSIPQLGVQAEVAQRLGMIAEHRDDETGAHAARVGAVSGAVARRLGVDPALARLLEMAAPLHDLGKVATPDAILHKRGLLTSIERSIMQRHTTVGAQMLAGSPLPVLQLAEEIALSHHEQWDGHGYPYGIAGDAIPLPGRIVAIADVFDALISERPYKRPWPLDEALAEVSTQRGRHFDPAVTDAFLSLDHAPLIERSTPNTRS
jgi:putative two-component system response regulator